MLIKTIKLTTTKKPSDNQLTKVSKIQKEHMGLFAKFDFTLK